MCGTWDVRNHQPRHERAERRGAGQRGTIGNSRAEHQVVALVQTRHRMTGLRAHRLGLHELDGGHAGELAGDLMDAWVDQVAKLGRQRGNDSRQRRTPDPAEIQPGVDRGLDPAC